MEKLKVIVTVDRPQGYIDSYGNVYPLNYGYIAGVIGGDGEEQDAYILNEQNVPVDEYRGIVIAVIKRRDDVEDKWVVAKEGFEYTKEYIEHVVEFMEKYFDSSIEML